MIRFPDTPEQFYQQTQVCQFGITEALGFAAADLGLAGIGDFLGFGAADAGAGAAAAAGPTFAGTVADTLATPTFDALAGGTVGGDMLGTAGSFLAAPGAVGAGFGAAGGFGAAADAALSGAASSGLATGTASIPSASAPIEALLSATPTTGAGVSAVGGPAGSAGASPFSGSSAGTSFDTPFSSATGGTTGTGSAFQPGTAGASSVSAPSSVAAAPDPTAATGGGTTGSTGATPAAGQNTSISQLLSKAGGGVTDALTKNPLATALGIGGLGYNIYAGQKNTANEKQLTADAAVATKNSNEMVANGEALQQYLTNGTLPPQYQQQVDNAINDAKTQAISNAAAQGQPTDPTKNTSLAQTLAGIDNQRAAMTSAVAGQLFNSGQGLINAGQSAAGLSGQLYQALVQNDTTQAGNIGKAITSLAAALNGKTQSNAGGTTITVG